MNPTLDPASAHTQYQRALQCFQAGEYEATLDALRGLLHEEEPAAKAWVLEGRTRAAMGEFQAAERAFVRACQVAPTHPSPWLEQAHFAHFLGHFQDALASLEKALENAQQKDEQREIFLLRAEILFAMLQAEISSQLEDQLDQEESLADGPIPMTPTLQALSTEGLDALQKALDIDARQAEAWDLQANYYTVLGQFKEASKAWRQALRIAPNHRQYLHDLGITLETMRDFQGAHETYQQLADLEALSRETPAFFPAAQFAGCVQGVWDELVTSLLPALAISLPIELWVEDIPARALLEKAPREEPFDPWLPMILDIEKSRTAHSTVHIILYQRNIERNANTDDIEEMTYFLQTLLEDCLQLLDAMMNQDEIRNTP